ncbi:MAG TPA: ferredoxin family protein [Kofleriaceae bacterium]|jgi:NAD-dependent dihydropyrimidine dehydrogenase PreA subunit|nr:ferredoxin family protein [Kofleriaceae bacterium]
MTRPQLPHRRRDRPGKECSAQPGTYTVVVDRNRCEGKGACVEVCPYGVFELGTIADAEFQALSLLGRLKSRAHGRKTAYTPRMSACQACGLCIVSCPEHALTLAPVPPGTPNG